VAALISDVQQLGLAVQLPDDEVFATFIAGENGTAIASLRAFVDGALHLEQAPWCLLQGPAGVGKSHLLHSLCAAFPEQAMYLSLNELRQQAAPQVLEGLAQVPLLCLDEIDAVVDDADWCYALFRLLNQLSDQNTARLVMTSRHAAQHLKTALPDLSSRLQWGLPLQLSELEDHHKVAALQLRAQKRGLDLHKDVAIFMIQRLGRSMASLMPCLAKLDDASLAAQRRLTIPFVKRALDI